MDFEKPILRAMRKYQAYFWIYIAFFIQPSAFTQQNDYSVNTIIIDPGHGGTDPGAIHKDDKNLMEKNINLEISKSLISLIKEKLPSIEIVPTRTGDYFVSLGERAKIANQYLKKNTIFISIHTNSHSQNKKVQGVEVFYHYASNSTIANFRMSEYSNRLLKDENKTIKTALGSIINTKAKEDSKGLAKYIGDGIHLASKEPIRQISPSNLYVVSYAAVPSILVEVGFISNEKLKDKKYLARLAKGIFLGILGYIKEKKYS